MKIESVTRSGDKPNRLTVLFEDGTEIKVNATQIADFGIYSGRELTEDEYGELLDTLELSSSKARAVRILGNRNLSARELERRLTGKGSSSEAAKKTVEWLEDIGAVNDVEYASSIVRHYSAKGYGPARIREELYRRGIPREMWDEALGDLDEAGAGAFGFLKKKLGESREKADILRATNALVVRGFGYEQARTAVRDYIDGVGSVSDKDE